MIFDKIRKKNIILQPEEKVRQWLINYFIELRKKLLILLLKNIDLIFLFMIKKYSLLY